MFWANLCVNEGSFVRDKAICHLSAHITKCSSIDLQGFKIGEGGCCSKNTLSAFLFLVQCKTVKILKLQRKCLYCVIYLRSKHKQTKKVYVVVSQQKPEE